MAVDKLRKVYQDGRVDVVAVDGVTLTLQAGEMVVTSGQLQLSPGMKVNPRPPDPNGPEKPSSGAGNATH